MTQEELILKYAELKKENARLRDGIEKVKAEIQDESNSWFQWWSDSENRFLKVCDILSIINKHLGEVK